MKKIILFLLLFSQLSILFSDEGGWDKNGFAFGFIGAGYTANKKFGDGYVYGYILNYMYQFDNGFGINVSPFCFSIYFNDIEKNNLDNYLLTFVNAGINYNFFKTGFFVLGPFVSVNAVAAYNPEYYEFRSGLTFSVRDNFYDTSFLVDLVKIECGYKYNKAEKHGFYLTVGVDLLLALYAYAIMPIF